MALIHSLEKQGNFLFRYRGQLPLALFAVAPAVVWFTDYSSLPARANFVIMALSVCLAVAGMMVRAYTIGTTPAGTSGRNTSGQVADDLNTTGIYSVVRHPLYLGNYLVWAGIVAYTCNAWFVITLTLAYWLYYERIMFAEERFLGRKFGDRYVQWSLTVPAFLPSLRRPVRPSVPFSLKSVLRREYSGALAAVTGFVYVHGLRHYAVTGSLNPGTPALYVFAVAVAVTLLLRTLKHHTALLSEKGRS